MANIVQADDFGVQSAIDCIRSGGVAVIPTNTNYNIVCDPFRPDAVDRIFKAKQRAKFGPLTLYLTSPEDIPRYTRRTPGFSLDLARTLWPGEISFILFKQNVITKAVTCGAPTIAVACHDHAVLQHILGALGHPLCGSSANLSGQGDILVTFEKAREDLAEAVDIIVDGGPTKASLHPSPEKSNTIVDFTFDPPVLVRKGLMDPAGVVPFIPDLILDTDRYKDLLRERMALR